MACFDDDIKNKDVEYFDPNKPIGVNDVVYIVISSGVKLVRHFSERKFAIDFTIKGQKGNSIIPVIHPNI